tara:strand:- start:14161 stop:15954 length:1794 start_codon:yes stop_codon:yes gene_type:complete
MSLFSRIAAAAYALGTPAPQVESRYSSLDEVYGQDVFGNSTLTGEAMSQQKALQLVPYYQGLDIISGDIAKLPFNVYRRIPDQANGRELAINSPAYRMLRRAPNAEMTPFVWFKTMMYDAVQGNGYSFIVRDAVGSVTELIKLDASSTTAVKVDGELWYYTTTKQGRQVWMQANEVIHFMGLSPDGMSGYNLWDKMRQSLGLSYSAQAYGAKFFANDASSGNVLISPKTLSPEARKNLRDSWERLQKGQDNWHKTAILEDGVELKQINLQAKDAQLLDTRKFSIREIAGMLRIPPHKLGDDSRVSYSSLEQENQSYLDTCLDPWLVMAEQELTKKLLTESQRKSGSVFIEANRNALLRIDSANKWTIYNTAVNNGLLSRNEARAKENLNAIEGLDIYTYPMNLQTVGDTKEEGTEESIDQIGDTEGDDIPSDADPDGLNEGEPGEGAEVDQDSRGLDVDALAQAVAKLITIPAPDLDAISRSSKKCYRDMMKATIDRIVKRWGSMLVKTMNSKKHKDQDAAVLAYRNDLAKAQANLSDELKPYCNAAGIDVAETGYALIHAYDNRAEVYQNLTSEDLAERLTDIADLTLASLGVFEK